MDPLQRLHTLDNLAELLRTPPPGAPRTLRDDRLQVGCWPCHCSAAAVLASRAPVGTFVHAGLISHICLLSQKTDVHCVGATGCAVISCTIDVTGGGGRDQGRLPGGAHRAAGGVAGRAAGGAGRAPRPAAGGIYTCPTAEVHI